MQKIKGQRNRTFTFWGTFLTRLSLCALHCTWNGWPPAADRSFSPGIMSHNVMLRSDWHGERHREGREEGWWQNEKEREREREGGNNDDDDDDEGPWAKTKAQWQKRRWGSICACPLFLLLLPLSPFPLFLSLQLTSIIHPFTPSLSPSQLVSPFLVLSFPVICILCHWFWMFRHNFKCEQVLIKRSVSLITHPDVYWTERELNLNFGRNPLRGNRKQTHAHTGMCTNEHVSELCSNCIEDLSISEKRRINLKYFVLTNFSFKTV